MLSLLLTIMLIQSTTIQDITFDQNLLIIHVDDGYTKLTYPGCEWTDEVGAPGIPVLSVLVARPRGARVTAVQGRAY